MCIYKTDDGKCKKFSDDKTTSWCVDAPCEYEKKSNYDKIRDMSLDEMAKFLASHIGHYEAPYKVKDIYRSAIDEKTGKGLIWIDAFKLWLESEAEE